MSAAASKMKHTPGPWHIGVRTYYAGRDVYGPHGQAVAVAELKLLMHPLEAEANARLIAAAPELLALLKRILYAHKTGNCGVVTGEATLCGQFESAARDVINKAEGVQS